MNEYNFILFSYSMIQTRKNRVFKKADLLNADGMLTTVWGPSMWHVLHTMSFNYPVTPTTADKRQYRDYVLSLQHVLPCKYCRINLIKNFKCLPLTMETMKNRDSFSRYIYNLHERVNKMLNKKSGLTYCDVRETYEHFRSRCTIAQFNKTVKNKKIETGCTEPLYDGEKSKCILQIVPQETKGDTLQVDDRCRMRKLPTKTRKIR